MAFGPGQDAGAPIQKTGANTHLVTQPMDRSGGPPAGSAPPKGAPQPFGGDCKGMNTAGLVLGVDPGLAATGYAVLRVAWGEQRGPGPRLLEAGLIRTAAGTPLPRRLQEIHLGLTTVLDQYRVSDVAVEDLYSNYRHPGTALLMAHARGIVLLAAAAAGAEVTAFPPARVKQALTGRGDASKEQVQHMVQNYLGLRELPQPDHVADAMAVALAHDHLRTGGAVMAGGRRR